jgi:hypothetical protein
MTINRYTETENKLISSDFRVHLASSPDVKRSCVGLTAFNSTTAISSIKFVAGSGSHDGTVYIYGVSNMTKSNKPMVRIHNSRNK